MVSNHKYPLGNVFGDEIGKMMYKEHDSNGVKLHMNTKVKEIKGENGKVKSVVLEDGT
jgi:NADPH-dependent 2,4-dienoyl-CoA reductase/sulfur reductase-like enzyme